MTHDDYQCVQQIRSRWQKEQELVRQKYQIPYNMTYTAKQCHSKPISILSQNESPFEPDKLTVIYKNVKRKPNQVDKHCFKHKKNESHIPPMYCSKCHSNLTECLCQNGIGQWWIRLQKGSHSTDHIFKKKSRSNSIPKRHVSFETSLVDLSSLEQSKSTSNKHQYVLLDWNYRQSLLHFLQTTQFTKNLSNMTIGQLRELITRNDHIHIFNSITNLILTVTKEQAGVSICDIYIDPFYYSTLQGANSFSQSRLIADNINLTRTLYSIQKIAILLGIKIDQHINQFSSSRLSTKQRQSILNQQISFIASKLPYNTFRHSSVHSQ